MVESTPERTTRLLNRLVEGDDSVSAELLERVYVELQTLAQHHMAKEAADHTLQPTALVHEAYLRLVHTPSASWASRGHFYAMASKVMRSLLVDHARQKNTSKRGGGNLRVPLEERTPAPRTVSGVDGYDVLDVNEALDALHEIDPHLVEVVELRYFGGLEVARMAEVTGVSTRTVERRLRAASAWLRKRLG